MAKKKSLLAKIGEEKETVGFAITLDPFRIEKLEIPKDGDDRLAEVRGVHKLIKTMSRDIVEGMNLILEHKEGESGGGIEEKKNLVEMIQSIALQTRHKLSCPKCGNPANIRCGISLKYPNGVFEFDHVIDGKRSTHRISEEFPKTRFVPVKDAP